LIWLRTAEGAGTAEGGSGLAPGGNSLMTSPAIVYAMYLTASLFLTVWVGRRLHRSGCPFLAEVFPDRLDVGRAVNDFLLTGYYLVNLALDVLLLSRPESLRDMLECLEWLGERVGVVLVTLGGLHMGNVLGLLAVGAWLRRRHRSSGRHRLSLR
jgi:hypothetical protein